MATVPAAPAAPQRDVVKAWQDAHKSIEKDLRRWAQRVGNGQPPLGAGEQQRLASLIKSAETLLSLEPHEAQIAAGVWNAATRAQKASLMAAATSIPGHVYQSAVEAGRASGWERVVNVRAYEAIVNNQIGALTSDFDALSLTQQEALAADLANAVATGGSPRELAKSVKGTVDEWFRTGQSRSVMIARTNMARAYDAASLAVYGDAAKAGLIKGWKWVANGKKPCDVCQTLNGTIFAPDEQMYRHPNCTCTNVPVLMDEKGKVGDRVDPRPDTNPDDLELWQSDNGWTTWKLKPKNPTGKAKGKVIQKGVKGKPKAKSRPRPKPKPKELDEVLDAVAGQVEEVKGLLEAGREASALAERAAKVRERFKERTPGRQSDKRDVLAEDKRQLARLKEARDELNAFIEEQNKIPWNMRDTKMIADKKAQYYRLNDEVKAYRAQRAQESDFNWDVANDDFDAVMEIGRAANKEATDRIDAWVKDNPNATGEQLAAKRREVFRQIVAEAREMNPESRPKFWDGKGERPVKGVSALPKKFHEAAVQGWRVYPKEWQDAVEAIFPELRVFKTSRGYFSKDNDIVALSYTPKGRLSAKWGMKDADLDVTEVAAHEFGHAMEYSVPGLRDMEHVWWIRRVNSGVPEAGKGGREGIYFKGYDGAHLPTKVDVPTKQTYTVKRYEPTVGLPSQDGAYEVFTTGVQNVLGDGWDDYVDDDLTEFVLGVLLSL